jgi:hypothetical protein
MNSVAWGEADMLRLPAPYQSDEIDPTPDIQSGALIP